MWDLSLHHHGVFVIQRAAEWKRSRKRNARLHFVDILVVSFQPGRALHARVPIRAIGIHSAGELGDKNNSQTWFLCCSCFSWLIRRGFHLSVSSWLWIKSSGEFSCEQCPGALQATVSMRLPQTQVKTAWGEDDSHVTSITFSLVEVGEVVCKHSCEEIFWEFLVLPKRVILCSRWKSHPDLETQTLKKTIAGGVSPQRPAFRLIVSSLQISSFLFDLLSSQENHIMLLGESHTPHDCSTLSLSPEIHSQ